MAKSATIQKEERNTPKQERAQATRQAILQAAAQILVADGFDRASTNRIAKRAGVSIGSLYQYFSNKEAIFGALAYAHFDELHEKFTEMVQDIVRAPLHEAVRACIEGLLKGHAVNPKLHRELVLLFPRLYSVEEGLRVQRRSRELIEVYLQQRADELAVSDIQLATFTLVTACDAVIHLALFEQPEMLAGGKLADELCRMVLRYLVE